jgi:hypothetical protein
MKIFLWTNVDMDAVGSTILLGNCYSNMEYRSVFFGDFETEYLKWEENADAYDKVFVVGIPLSQSTLNKIDRSNITVVLDTDDDLNAKKAKLIIKEESSCCKLLYKILSKKYTFTPSIIKLIAHFDDYNSYELKYPLTKCLNALYRKSGSRKFQTFVNRFWGGLTDLTPNETMLCDQYTREIDEELQTLDVYSTKYQDRPVVATFSKLPVNEIAAYLLTEYKADVAIVVNPSTEFVSFRKSTASPIDLRYMAENLCNGGGGQYAAGGKLTHKFMEFSQDLILL